MNHKKENTDHTGCGIGACGGCVVLVPVQRRSQHRLLYDG
ncbi:iron-sulfur cluster-binding protein [Caproiciproducens sp. NJN-50]